LSETPRLDKEGRATERNSKEYKELAKNIKKDTRKDVRKYKTELINNTIEENRDMKVLKSKLSQGNAKITKL
ncbi:hypothetical protein HUJ04_010916, partial [Dendroctonus ponderosae]